MSLKEAAERAVQARAAHDLEAAKAAREEARERECFECADLRAQLAAAEKRATEAEAREAQSRPIYFNETKVILQEMLYEKNTSSFEQQIIQNCIKRIQFKMPAAAQAVAEVLEAARITYDRARINCDSAGCEVQGHCTHYQELGAALANLDAARGKEK